MKEKKLIDRLNWAINRLEMMGCKSYTDVQMIARIRQEIIIHNKEIQTIKDSISLK